MNSVVYLYYVENGSNNLSTMNGMAMEIDPLGTYEYPNYDSYGNITTPYNYEKKVDGPVPYNFNQNYNTLLPNNLPVIDNITTNVPDTNVEKNFEIPVPNNCIETVNSDDKPVNDIKPVIADGKLKQEKVKGKRSSYWSVKIADKDFAFYGCSVCNISFKTLQELDQHVTVHKDRITSYDLRVQNQMKRKRLKKEKKVQKIKLEKPETVEIKPEDGYIGTEKASEFNENSLVSNKNNTDSNKNEEEDKSEVKKSRSKEKNVCKSLEKGGEGKNEDLQKIYKCFACQKKFTLSYYLRLHVRSHTDEKPYTCSVCGQSFITASKLGRHNKRIHLAIRYQCRICFKYFSQFDLLTRHFDKKHVEDKLEGEPYDYNAILPYLKELEEQMKEKTEEEKKPKVDELWPDKWVGGQEQGNNLKVEQSERNEKELRKEPQQFLSFNSPSPDIIIDELSIHEEDIVKQELEDDDFMREDQHEMDYKDDNSCSDEDYFPSNTWARVSPPRLEPETPPSPRRTRRSKGDGPITCDICQKTISSVTYLRIHMRTHTGEKPFKCYICNRGFITSSKMHRHVLTHSETWDETVMKREEVKSEGEGNEDLEEDVKGKKVKKSKSKFHKKRQKKGPEKQKKRYQKRPHSCEFCQKRFLHLETLQVHKKSHEGEPLVLKCNYCLEEMPDEAARSEHETSHSGPKPYVCTLCGKCYKKRETLVYHRKHHKPDKREYICDICSKRFNSPGKLQRHLVSHRVDKFVLRYECPVCAHMFNTKYHVQMHLSTHQKEGLIMEENRNEILAMVLQNARKFPKQPDAPSNLTDTMPSDERSRICNICGEIFQHFYYLEEHLKGHGSRIAIEDLNKPEEKKYTCQVCKKSFKLHYYLKLHSFTHTKEKPFICQQCGKGFITKGKLKRHLETHTGLKKYQCHVCYKFFTRPSYLRIHVRTIHGTQDYNFRLDKGYGSLGGLSVMTHLSQGSV